MKRSLSKILARMARDGDVETVAEIIEEMMEPEAPAETAAEEVAEEVAEAVAEVAEEPAAVVETPEGTTVVVDEASLADIISRLDQIIALLTPTTQDEYPVEEIVEAVAEAVEAAAEAEAAAELPEAVQEVAEIVEEILEPEAGGEIPEILATEEDECGEEESEVLSTGDALRAALTPMRPMLAKMPKKQRTRVCADIAARLNGKTVRKGIYGSMRKAADAHAADPRELGRRIMASRSANKQKT